MSPTQTSSAVAFHPPCIKHWTWPVITPNQSIHRHAQDLGLTTKIQQDRKFKNNVKLLASLAFVPVRDIRKRFVQIVEWFPKELMPLVEYFETVYVGTTANRATFDPHILNLHEWVQKGIPRTSNLIEGWHNRFRRSLKISKPPFWRFLLALLHEQNRTENVIVRRHGFVKITRT